MSSIIDKQKSKNLNKSLDFVLFFGIWDEELGPEVINFCPKSSILDLESLAVSIFATYQFFWDKPDEQYASTKVTLPVVNLNRKAHVLLDVVHNPEVRGGFQPFIVVLLVPDYIVDKKLEIFDAALIKVAKRYIEEKKVFIEEGFGNIEEIYAKEQEIKESKFEISALYSYTVAVDDFRAGVQLFQTKNYDDAYPLLYKALMKFEQEDHKNLIMEAIYLIASLFAQKKQFSSAEEHYLRLELLAEELQHQKYREMSVFMSGFCAYKNERYVEAIQQFSKIELIKKQFINEFQYHTIYGRALANLQSYDDSIKKLKSALRIIKTMEQSQSVKKQQGQINYELGIVNYKLAIEKTKSFGINKQKEFKNILDDAISYFESSGVIWIEIEDTNQLIKTYGLIGDIFEFLRDDSKFFEYYNKALEYAENNKDIGNQIKILKRIIQKQALLGQYEENIKSIRKVLDKFESYKLFDLHTAAILHKHLGISLVKTNQINEGLQELEVAFEILDKFKTIMDDEIPILNRIIILCTKLGNNDKIAYYSKKREEISEKLREKEFEEEKEVRYLGLLKDIWIFSRSIGIELYGYSLETKVESDLLGGFMTAIQALSEQVAYKNIDSMVFGDDRFTIYQEENRDFYILARSSAKISEDTIERTLSTIYNRFWKEFYNSITNFEGNVAPFKKFTKILESFDWTLISLEMAAEEVVTRKRIAETRTEMKALVDGTPVEQKALPMDQELTSKVEEEGKKMVKAAAISEGDLKAEEVEEEEMTVYKEKRICLVHKGPIEGYMFMCPDCGAFYCVKCVDALIEIENFCWSCERPLDPTKPTQKEDMMKEEEEIKIDEGAKRKSPKKAPKK
jgi:tetratricopeptide (TPR) repeat protein